MSGRILHDIRFASYSFMGKDGRYLVERSMMVSLWYDFSNVLSMHSQRHEGCLSWRNRPIRKRSLSPLFLRARREGVGPGCPCCPHRQRCNCPICTYAPVHGFWGLRLRELGTRDLGRRVCWCLSRRIFLQFLDRYSQAEEEV